MNRPAMNRPAHTVLIQTGDLLENRQRTLAFGRACKDVGWWPVMLVYSQASEAFFLEYGIDAVALDRFRRSPRRPILPWRAYRASGASLSAVHRGVRLDDVCRMERATHPQKFWPGRLRAHFSRLRADIDALDALLRHVRPHTVAVWNGHTGRVANVLRAFVEAKRARGVFLERGLVPGALFVDPSGTNGASDLAAMPAEAFADAGADTFSRSRLRAAVEGPPPCAGRQDELRAAHGLTGKTVVFVPLQVETDTNIVLHGGAVRTMRMLCLAVLDAVRHLGRDDIVVVARPHPEESPGRMLNLPCLDDFRVCAEGRLEDWLDLASVVVTVNSTVGLQAVLRDTPTIVLGRALYGGKGFTHDVSAPELPEALARLVDTPCLSPSEGASLDRFLAFLIRNRTISDDHVGRREDNIRLVRTIIGEPERPAHGCVRPFNTRAIDPDLHAAACLTARARFAKSALAATEVNVLVDLRPSDRLSLTYRRANEPVTAERVDALLASCLGATAPHRRMTRNATEIAPGLPLIVIAPAGASRLRRSLRGRPVLMIDLCGTTWPAPPG